MKYRPHIVLVRISDNVTCPDVWPMRALTVDCDGIVTDYHDIPAGSDPVYSMSGGPSIGWHIRQVLDWATPDDRETPVHPEIYREILPNPRKSSDEIAQYYAGKSDDQCVAYVRLERAKQTGDRYAIKRAQAELSRARYVGD